MMKMVDIGVAVAPHAGAWIETVYMAWGEIWQVDVAPHAGAWIETG